MQVIDLSCSCKCENDHPCHDDNTGYANCYCKNEIVLWEFCNNTEGGGSTYTPTTQETGFSYTENNNNNGGDVITMDNTPQPNGGTNGTNTNVDVTVPTRCRTCPPVLEEANCEEIISGLTEIINTPEIKAELDRLKNMPQTTYEEDGKRFIYTGTGPSNPTIYNDASFDEQLPSRKFGNSLEFPPLQNNTLVGAHFHPDFDINGDPIRRVPSGLDIAEHINMIKKVYQTNPAAAVQVTNFVLSKGSTGKTYILRANNVQNIVDNTKDYNKEKNRRKIHEKVYKLIHDNYDEFDFEGHETAITSFLAEEFPDLTLYKAEYDENGNITKLCELKTQD